MSTELEATYRAYIGALNERRFDDLDQYVHDDLTYNSEKITRQQYEDLLTEGVHAIPDLYYDIQLLVVSGDQVACRLWFDCTPEHLFLGIAPNGLRASFAEHVFYRFREGRIEQVWSLIDTDTLREQLA